MGLQVKSLNKPMRGAQLNRAHPLGAGIVSAYLFNEDTGYRYYDYADSNLYLQDGNIPPTPGLGFVNSLINSREPFCIGKQHLGNFYGSGHYAQGVEKNLPSGSKPFSVFWRSARSNISNFCEWQFGSSGTTGAMRGFRCTGANSASFLGWAADLTVSCGTVTNVWNIWCVTYDGTTIRIYQNGLLQGSGALALSGISNGFLRIAIDTFNSGVVDSSAMDFWYCYNRALSAADVRALTADPYAPFTQRQNAMRGLLASVLLTANLNDTLSFTDTPSSLFTAALSEDFSSLWGDAISFFVGNIEALADTLTFLDGLVTSLDIFANLSDSLSFSDGLSYIEVCQLSLTDTITFFDSLTTQDDVSANLSDTLNFSDALTYFATCSTQLSDLLTFVDNLLEDLRLSYNLNDQITFADAISGIDLRLKIQLADAIAIFDNLTAADAIVSRSASDSILLTDAVMLQMMVSMMLSDTLDLVDLVTPSLADNTGMGDSFTLSDAVAIQLYVHLQRTAADQLTFTDQVSTIISGANDDYLRRYLNDKSL